MKLIANIKPIIISGRNKQEVLNKITGAYTYAGFGTGRVNRTGTTVTVTVFNIQKKNRVVKAKKVASKMFPNKNRKSIDSLHNRKSILFFISSEYCLSIVSVWVRAFSFKWSLFKICPPNQL